MTSDLKILVVSHACIRQINRAVYRELQKTVRNIKIVIPDAVVSAAGNSLKHEPQADGDPEIIPLTLQGDNPRSYTYEEMNHVLQELRPDIIILENDAVSRLAFALSAWCKKNKSKFICQTYENTRRGIITTLREQGWKAIPKNTVIYLLNLWMSRRVDALLVVNRESERIFKSYEYRNVTRIPLGYDKSIFHRDENLRVKYRSKLSISSETRLIAYFGRMSAQKGVHLLIKALADLKSLEWKLLLDHAFDPQDRYATGIQALIKETQLENRVMFFEADHFEIANYMRAADIMVAPSITTQEFKEQYGRAVQEAMACGCVCLVSDSGHLPDLVGDTSLVFQENNIGALTACLKKWLVNADGMESCKLELANRAYSTLTTESQAKAVLQLFDNEIRK